MKVATFNVQHGRGGDGIVDLDRTAEVMRSLGADVIGLQELDRGSDRSGRADQPAFLSSATGLQVFFHATLERDGGRYGIGIATREDAEVEPHPLPRVGKEEPRAALVARFSSATVVNTHLSRNETARREQTLYLAALLSTLDGPVVLVGDLNERHRRLDPLRAAGLVPGPSIPTHPARRPRRQVDHILAGGGATVVETAVVTTDASDHLPLVARVRLP